MAKRNGLRPWLQNRFTLVMVAVPAVLLGCILGTAVGFYRGLTETIEEVAEAWRILSRGDHPNDRG